MPMSLPTARVAMRVISCPGVHGGAVRMPVLVAVAVAVLVSVAVPL